MQCALRLHDHRHHSGFRIYPEKTRLRILASLFEEEATEHKMVKTKEQVPALSKSKLITNFFSQSKEGCQKPDKMKTRQKGELPE